MPFDTIVTESTKAPPHNMEAEQSILGCLFTNNAAYDDIAHIIKPEHFYTPVHAEIYLAISRTIESGRTASPVTLKGQFNNHPDLQDRGGGMYLAELAGAIVSTVNTIDYAETIKELYTRRVLIDGLHEVIAAAQNNSALDRGSVLQAANQCVNSLVDDMPAREYTAKSAIQESMLFIRGIKNGTIKSMSTGLEGLDNVINGLYGGLLYVIAGRPGMGKTALALNIADNTARQNNDVTSSFFSLEMSGEQLGMRLLARESGIDVRTQRSPHQINESQWHALERAQQFYDATPLYIEDCAGITLSMILSKARKIRRVRGRFVLVIDYLQLMRSEARAGTQMVHQIAEITSGLKVIAKELDIPVIILSQLSRGVEQREDKRPLKSDLRDSGAIEQDADVIIFPYRHEYYLARQEPVRREGEGDGQYDARCLEWKAQLMNARDKAELIIAKNRYGVEQSVHMSFDGPRQLFHSGCY